MKDLLFIKANASLPAGQVTTTARKGDKWSKAVKPGDIVNLLITENGANFGRAAIVGTRLTTLKEVIANAASDNNHALGGKVHTVEASSELLAADLKAAYGELEEGEAFTIVALVLLNPDHVGV